MPIPGFPPNVADRPPGCPFAPRCGYVRPHCTEAMPPLAGGAPGRLAACSESDRLVEVLACTEHGDAAGPATAMLRVSGLTKRTRAARRGCPARSRSDRAPSRRWTASTCTLRRGEILALVGESGSGKSTLAKILVGQHAADRRDGRYAGARPRSARRRTRSPRRRVQMVFQDPYSSLNPRMTVGRDARRAAAAAQDRAARARCGRRACGC